ncbi:MAG: leucine-rich repeat protein [Firmicutes bacterium]|nr:leucine-rich repeat protein [Bacillota bacterium]
MKTTNRHGRAKAASYVTAFLVALVLSCGFAFGCGGCNQNPDDPDTDPDGEPTYTHNSDDTRNYGNVVGVAAAHSMSRAELLELIDPQGDGSAPPSPGRSDGDMIEACASEFDASEGEASGSFAGNDYTVTNSQEEGVAEGDIIQVDANYLYMLSRTGLTIATARGKLRAVYRDELKEFIPDEMFIFGDLLVVIGGEYSYINYSVNLGWSAGSWYGARQSTRIILYDIKDREKVKRLEEYSISGAFVTSRKIDDNLVVVTNHTVNRWYWDTLFPKINGEELDVRYVHMHDTQDYSSYVVLASLNLKSLSLSVAGHMGLKNSVQYFSRDNVYFIAGFSEPADERGNRTDYSRIVKISLSSLLTTANRTIEGRVLNRYWVSEYNGALRLVRQAYTSGSGNLGRHTNLYILDEKLADISFTTQIAWGQTIHGVRFSGNLAVVDTYILIHIKIDGVSRIDLTDPLNPVITEGEPDQGVNDYLQFLTDDAVIGLGRNTVTVNNYTEYKGIKTTLYHNVDGVLNVAGTTTLGNYYAYTEALDNPRAILNDPARGMFSFPITMNGQSSSGYGWYLEGQGLAVYGYSVGGKGAPGLTYKGLLSNLPQNHYFDSRDLYFHALSFVTRGARVGDRIFTFSDRFITSYNASTLELIDRLELTLNVCSLIGCDMPDWTYVSYSTCTADGERHRTCARCGREDRQVLDAWGGHRFDEWKITTLPSDNSPGAETRVCRGGCGTVESRPLENHANANGLILRYDAGTNSYSVRTYMGASGTVIIPALYNGVPVTSVEPGAFIDINATRYIYSVTIGKNITAIGDNAFVNLPSLSRVTFENGSVLATIGNSAFADTGLTSVVLPEGLQTIGDYAFNNVMSLTAVRIPVSVQSIGASAFASDLWSSGYRNYRVSNLAEVIFEEGSRLTTIGSSAFANTSLTSVVIPASVETIGGNAFSTSVNAERASVFGSVTFEAGSRLSSIGSGAFNNTKLANVVIPKSVKEIGSSAFSLNGFLTSVVFEEGSALTTLGYGVFENTRLTSITLPSKLGSVPGRLFLNVTTLSSVTFEGGGEAVTDIGGSAFENTDLRSIDIPKNVKTIGGYAFRNVSRLTSVSIPDGVTSVGYGAFREMGGLTSVSIPATVTSIGSGAFAYCPALTDLALDGGNQAYRLVTGVLIQNSNNTAVAGIRGCRLSAAITDIGSEAFSGMGLTGSLVIEAGSRLEVIGISAFADNPGLTGINLEAAASLLRIDSRAFQNTTSITVINIPAGVYTVSPWAFDGWKSHQAINVLGADGVLFATIKLGVNWMAGSDTAVNYIP